MMRNAPVLALAAMLSAVFAASSAEAIGMGASLGDLATLSSAKSRCISPENITGVPGKAAMALPSDPIVRNVNNASGYARAAGLGQGWKINPFIYIGSHETVTLADADGPGVVRHVWMTLTENWRNAILRIYWDGEATPSVEVPVADFFCQGWCEYAEMNSPVVCVNPGSAFNCYWPMPFRRHFRMTMENIGPVESVLFYFIDYSLQPVPDDQAYFHAQFRYSDRDESHVCTILDGVKGRGHFVGMYLAWGVHNDGWWGEGEVKFYIDDDRAFPTLCSTGLEDYFCGSYNFDRNGRYKVFTTPYAGLCQVLPPDQTYKAEQKFGLYRWHIQDPVRFERELRVTAQDLGMFSGGKQSRYVKQLSDVASTAFWYQTEPHAPFPALPAMLGSPTTRK